MYEGKSISFKFGYNAGRKNVENGEKSVFPGNMNLVKEEYNEGFEQGKQDAVLKKVIG